MNSEAIDRFRKFWANEGDAFRAIDASITKEWTPEPGTGVRVKDQHDANYDRDGHVRVPTNEGYDVVFEPGVPDTFYRPEQLEPSGHDINPNLLPNATPTPLNRSKP